MSSKLQADDKTFVSSDEVGLLNKRLQRPQPWFIASPARDGGAIDWLPGLPFAWSLHGSRIRFGPQARTVPREAAGRDDSPDDWFGRAGQFFIINFDEAIRRQHLAPMLDEPLIVAEILDQF